MNKREINKKIYKINYIYNKIFKENFNKRLTFDWSSKPLRFNIINNAIKIKKYKNYLEIGCFKNENFDKINIESKTGVDPVSGGTIRDTSDNFFLKNQIFYDIIFIDGLHIYNQVKKDIANSLKFLKPNGIIILHDCLPLKIRDQMVPRSHEHWNGDTWKALVEIRTLENVDSYTILADNGLGVVFKRKNRNILDLSNTNFEKLKFKDYYNNFNKFMNPIEYEEFVKLLNQNNFD
jgi:hypothetical protein